MKKNGKEIGGPDYLQSMLKANGALVQQFGKIVRGNMDIKSTMARLAKPDVSPQELQDWKMPTPLMSPLLSSPNAEHRLQIATFLRSLGCTVRQDVQNYTLDDN
jgi:hypothetical protein